MAFPDYYKLLSVTKSATQDEIRTAYKKESLRTHPDRIANATPAEKKKATEKFQATRRREYDALYSSRTRGDPTDDPASSTNFFSQFTNLFGGAGPGREGAAPTAAGERPDPEGVFADVFEELLRPEVEKRPVSVSSSQTFPGLMLGAVAGNRLGAIRDAKGKSVAAVFGDLGGNQKAEILRALAMKVLGSAL
ncbi:hypothetical protein C8R46DRAFT_1091243 [Mycena filopes]|nr:hypothetical protein C8R46DRAFT_1091243 [Mycena filopes]